MAINVSIVVPEKDFPIRGASYIGAPRSNTAMFITKKVAHLLTSLESVAECLVFAEEGIDVPESLRKQHAFSFSRNIWQSFHETISTGSFAPFECEGVSPITAFHNACVTSYLQMA